MCCTVLGTNKPGLDYGSVFMIGWGGGRRGGRGEGGGRERV